MAGPYDWILVCEIARGWGFLKGGLESSAAKNLSAVGRGRVWGHD